MATLPYFVFSPNSLISLIGLLRGPDRTVPTPAESWRDATVDVIIPALNEEATIAACLASVWRQTLTPRGVMLVDDGSADRTIAVAEAFAASVGMALTVIRRRAPIGKTPTIKRQAWELDSDVEFILDGDTILDSENYIARAVEELYKAIGVASACGTIMPLRSRDRRRFDAGAPLRQFVDRVPHARLSVEKPAWRRVANGVTNIYREVLYLYLQRFVYLGEVVAFGSITNPVGCAVAYRRKYVKDLFDKYHPIFGDDLTNSEDIFIGFALVNEGYRNVQLTDVYARTVEPEVQRLPRQLYLWSSSFLQCCYYFDDLLRSAPRAVWAMAVPRRRGRAAGAPAPAARAAEHPQPFVAVGMGDGVPVRTLPRHAHRSPGVGEAKASDLRSPAASFGWQAPYGPRAGEAKASPYELRGGDAEASPHEETSGIERRRIAEPYRQPFGVAHTRRYGRPLGWVLLTGAIEKIGFPTALIIMLLLRAWEPLVITLLAETCIAMLVLVLVTRGRRLEYFGKGLVVAPLRYVFLLWDFVTIQRFALDLWVTRNRKWRK